MTTQENEQLAQLRAELARCPKGESLTIMGAEKLEELLSLMLKEQAEAA